MHGVPSLYRIAPDLHMRRLDDAVLLYLTVRLETHLIDDAGGQVLEAVQQMQDAAKPCSMPALYAWLVADTGQDTAAHLEAAPEAEAEAVLMPLLSELVRVGALTTQAC